MNLKTQFEGAVAAKSSLAKLSQDKIRCTLEHLADAAIANCEVILEANAKDLALLEPSNPLRDRLLLSRERIEAIAADMRSVASLRSPVGETISSSVRPNGMCIDKVCVPFGVIGVIYEARPNVSFDVFALCFKSSNCCILKGGSDALHSNEAIVKLIKQVLEAEGVDPRVVTLLPSDRQATAQLLDAVGYVDLIIPRGSSSLINYVRDNSRVPTIETGAGVCHTYIDKYADIDKASRIVFNAKTRRVSVCNALDTIVIHSTRLADVATICLPLATKNVVIYADKATYAQLEGEYPTELLRHASTEDFGREFLDYKLSICSVDSLNEAIEFVSAHTSHHSEAIVTERESRGSSYCAAIDAACLYVNVSTAFTDGAQFGLGAEIGISTQKLHARGPMALAELTVYKYIISGDGQTRQ